MLLELYDVKVQVVEGSTHCVEVVFRLHQQLVEAVSMRPFFLLLGESAIMTQTAPLLAGAADPAVEDLAIVKIDNVAELIVKFDELEICFPRTKLMANFVSYGNQGLRVVRRRRHREKDQVLAISQTLDDLVGGLSFLGEFLRVLVPWW